MTGTTSRALKIMRGDSYLPEKQEIRQLLAEIEHEMCKFPQIEVPLAHYFSDAVYAREMNVPAGMLLMGKIHKKRSMNIISKGEVSILSIDGIIRVRAPYSFVSSPGAKRLILVHEDTTWTTIHGSEETDLAKLEDEFIAKSYDEVEELVAAAEIAQIKEA